MLGQKLLYKFGQMKRLERLLQKQKAKALIIFFTREMLFIKNQNRVNSNQNLNKKRLKLNPKKKNKIQQKSIKERLQLKLKK